LRLGLLLRQLLRGGGRLGALLVGLELALLGLLLRLLRLGDGLVVDRLAVLLLGLLEGLEDRALLELPVPSLQEDADELVRVLEADLLVELHERLGPAPEEGERERRRALRVRHPRADGDDEGGPLAGRDHLEEALGVHGLAAAEVERVLAALPDVVERLRELG